MRGPFFVAVSIVLFASAAMAQGKVDTKWHCPGSAAEHKFDVGDVPGHAYAIAQGTCNATSTAPDFKEKSGAYTQSEERWKTRSTSQGHFNVTMDNGDMVYYTYRESVPTDIKKPASNTWKIHSGTGKYKGIKGAGGCQGTLHEDGSSDWVCMGTYSMGK